MFCNAFYSEDKIAALEAKYSGDGEADAHLEMSETDSGAESDETSSVIAEAEPTVTLEEGEKPTVIVVMS